MFLPRDRTKLFPHNFPNSQTKLQAKFTHEPLSSHKTHGLGLVGHTKSLNWIYNCEAIDIMTFDPRNCCLLDRSRKHIQNSNGACISVDHTGPVDISPFIHLNNCLLIPNLSHKLLSISQPTKELNCIIIMSSIDCIVQDAQTEKIIGCGTQRGDLYSVDETTHKGQAMLTRGSPDYHFWMWYRRLDHPSLTYLKHLFPSFKTTTLSLDCEACVLEKVINILKVDRRLNTL